MLEAIKKIGEYETEKEGTEIDDIEKFVEKVPLKNTKKVICIVFKNNNGDFVYDHIYIEDYDESKSIKYLYRSTQHKHYNVTPTAKITTVKGNVDIKNVIENVKNQLFRWFNTYSNKGSLLLSLKKALEEKQEEIFRDFASKYQELTKDERNNSILTIIIQDNGVNKYIGDIEIFKEILKESGEEKFKSRKWGGKKVEAKGSGICCICTERKEVFGLALPFPFYTVDKRGFAPEFNREDAWKRLPICKKCAEHLMAGKNFLDTYTLKSFYQGYKFYLIPNFVLGEIDEELIKEIKRQERNKEYSVEKYSGLLIEDDYILEPIKNRGDSLNLIFMFIQQKQGGFDIAKYVEDVPPSWLNRLYANLQEVNRLPIFKEETLKKLGIVGKKRSGDLKDIDNTRIGGLVESFFLKPRETTGIYSKYFIDIVGDILAQKPINKDLLFSAFMREIRNREVNKKDYEEKILVLKSFMLVLFLKKVNLIKI